MIPVICPLYGPFAIQSYGVAIAIGLFVFLWFASRDPRRHTILPGETLYNLTIGSIIAAIVGGRILQILSTWHEYESWYDFFAIWEGGFSILGTMIAVALYVWIYLYRHGLSLLPTSDFCAQYVPILQFFGRIGCFMAGCCHGYITDVPWAITYVHPESAAPLYLALHPTQLYSAAAYLVIFIILQIARNYLKQPGQLAMLYLMFASTERFILDFWRDDRIPTMTIFSFHQVVAAGIAISAAIAFIYFSIKRAQRSS